MFSDHGRIGYEAYAVSTGGKTFPGDRWTLDMTTKAQHAELPVLVLT